ncbi:MAG: 30S ribosomal protein S6 [Thermodesulfobacteriota bacterium]
MRNRRYETVFILPSDSDEGKKKDILDRLDSVVEKGGGIRVKREDWGVRRLAYPVKNQAKGHYFLLDFVGTAQIVAELERHMRMLEDVHRFLTVKTDDRVDLEAAQKEQAEEKDKEVAKEAAAKEAAAKEAAAKEAASAQAVVEAEEAALSEASEAEATQTEEGSGQEADPLEEAEEEALDEKKIEG